MKANDFFRMKQMDENAMFTHSQLVLFAEQLALQNAKESLIELYSKTLDFSKITNVEVDGIDTKDYPDFCDAFIQACDYDGEPASEEVLEAINENTDFVYSEAIKKLF